MKTYSKFVNDLLIHRVAVPLLRWRRLFDKSKFETINSNFTCNTIAEGFRFKSSRCIITTRLLLPPFLVESSLPSFLSRKRKYASPPPR